MYGESSNEHRLTSFGVVVLVALLLSAWMVIVDRSEAAPAPPVAADLVAAGLQMDEIGGEGGAIFAKYEAIDGESDDANHGNWIDVLAYDWGAGLEGPPAAGPTRARAGAVAEGFRLTFDYEKASPKLEEKLFKGAVIPKLEVELTSTFDGSRATYLRYELVNVLVTDFTVTGVRDGGPATVTFTNTFEEIKVTYTEYDEEGTARGNVEYQYRVE